MDLVHVISTLFQSGGKTFKRTTVLDNRVDNWNTYPRKWNRRGPSVTSRLDRRWDLVAVEKDRSYSFGRMAEVESSRSWEEVNGYSLWMER